MKLWKIGVFIVLLHGSVAISGQEQIKIYKKEFKTDQVEGFKEAWKSISQGDKYYKQGIGTYSIARDHYLFAQLYNDQNAALNYKIGACYLYTDNKRNAIDYLLNAYELNSKVSQDIKYLIARAYHLMLEFEKAKFFYAEYRDEIMNEEDSESKIAEIDKRILECNNGASLTQNPQRVIIQNLGEEVNSSHDDYNPRFAYNDTALFFTSRRPLMKNSKRNELDNKFNEDNYICSFSNGKFYNTRLVGMPFWSKGNDAIVSVAPDGRSLFVYKGDKNGGDIQQARYIEEKGKWKKPKSLKKYLNSDAAETTAALSPDGQTLYYISSNPELSIGGKDIMVTTKNEKGKWGEPKNLGGIINSMEDEEGVYLSKDGQTMYFSSEGHNSMGGFDVYKTVIDKQGRWDSPENLGYPINTPDDEVFYVTDASGTYGYFATIREDGFGGMDIYKVIRLGKEKEVSTLTAENLVAGFDYLKKNPILTFPELITVDTVLMIAGRVRDTIGDTDTVILAALSFMDPSTGDVAARAMTGSDGYYRTKLPEPKMYGVEINATGYLYYLDVLDLSGVSPDELVEQDFFLKRLEIGTKVVLENIYFEINKSLLTVQSYEALNQVTRFLEKNKSVRLEISGHTDNTGTLKLNTRLSEARAKAVVDYIVAQGIDEGRLEYRGYADTQPVATNSTAEGREKNRRVEFKVIDK